MHDEPAPLTWLITGASFGLGQQLARKVLAAGHRAVITARTFARLEPLARDYPNTALAAQLDVTKSDDIAHVVKDAEARFGRIDVLVNNAGVGYLAAVEEGDDREIRAVFETNFFGAAAVVRAVLPTMRKNRSGLVVNVSSVGGFLAAPDLGYYNATKFALEGLTEALWQEVEPLGIEAMLIEPGGLRTGILERNVRSERIADYLATAGAVRASFDTHGHLLPGDPVRAATAIFEVVTRPGKKPHRLLLGSDSYDGVLKKLRATLAELEPQEAIARSIDFPK